MSRSLKKGPYVHFKLNRKVEKNIQDNKKTVIKTWSSTKPNVVYQVKVRNTKNKV